MSLQVDDVLRNLEGLIAQLEMKKANYSFRRQYTVRCRDVCSQLSIFDWFPETISLTRLKDMQKFLLTAKKLGFNGYCCFKVGEEGTASGKWAYKVKSEDGYSPRNCECLYESFYASQNYWQVSLDGNTFYPNGSEWNSVTTKKGIEKVWTNLNNTERKA